MTTPNEDSQHPIPADTEAPHNTNESKDLQILKCRDDKAPVILSAVQGETAGEIALKLAEGSTPLAKGLLGIEAGTHPSLLLAGKEGLVLYDLWNGVIQPKPIEGGIAEVALGWKPWVEHALAIAYRTVGATPCSKCSQRLPPGAAYPRRRTSVFSSSLTSCLDGRFASPRNQTATAASERV